MRNVLFGFSIVNNWTLFSLIVYYKSTLVDSAPNLAYEVDKVYLLHRYKRPQEQRDGDTLHLGVLFYYLLYLHIRIIVLVDLCWDGTEMDIF